MDVEGKLAALAKAARALNAANIVWAVGASALLYLEGAADTFNDLDVLIAGGAFDAARQAMLSLGAVEKRAPVSEVFATDGFAEFQLDGVDFDILCGFAVRRGGNVYRYAFDAEHVTSTADVKGVPVPLSPLADWFVLYLLMPGREKKARRVAAFLKAHPRTERRRWLGLWLDGRLPGDVREQTLALYGRPGF
jgi:hypothetical protein